MNAGFADRTLLDIVRAIARWKTNVAAENHEHPAAFPPRRSILHVFPSASKAINIKKTRKFDQLALLRRILPKSTVNREIRRTN